ncbi:MAG: WYL domain-containing transcriptional regulator [Verrucomicrobiota bacterium]|nr:WYL domain-containing transcriptional regulator [Verrucomicrobiota bacterium]
MKPTQTADGEATGAGEPTVMAKCEAKKPAREHFPLERLLKIQHGIQAGGNPTCQQLAEVLGISKRTVQRSIRYLKEMRGHAIVYDPKTDGYSYQQDVATLTELALTRREMMGLFLSSKAYTQHAGTPFQAEVKSAIKKLGYCLRGQITFSITGLERALSFKHPVAVVEPHITETLCEAMLDGEEIRFDYRNGRGEKTESRNLQPWGFRVVEQKWYVLGFCTLRMEERTFALSRISNPRKTGGRFTRPGDFNPEERLTQSFGVYKGSESHAIHLRFTADAAPQVRERVWHASQSITELPEGGIEFSLRLDSLVEIERWILGWGDRCTVLGPPALIEQIKAVTRSMAGKYGVGSGAV